MNLAQLQRLWGDLSTQLAANARLRAGMLGIMVILWVYALLLVADHVAAMQAVTTGVREELARVQPLAKERVWADRANDARQNLAALQGMAWTEADLGLVEASLQDWIKALSGKTGLPVRELTIARSPSAAAPPPASASASAAAAGPQPIRARVVADLNRLALMGFLLEVARYERIVVVDRMTLRLASQPVTVELDLRVLGMAVGAKP